VGGCGSGVGRNGSGGMFPSVLRIWVSGMAFSPHQPVPLDQNFFQNTYGEVTSHICGRSAIAIL